MRYIWIRPFLVFFFSHDTHLHAHENVLGQIKFYPIWHLSVDLVVCFFFLPFSLYEYAIMHSLNGCSDANAMNVDEVIHNMILYGNAHATTNIPYPSSSCIVKFVHRFGRHGILECKRLENSENLH